MTIIPGSFLLQCNTKCFFYCSDTLLIFQTFSFSLFLFLSTLLDQILYRSQGGKFVLRVDDADLERSTRKSEEVMLNVLSLFVLDWDEGEQAHIFGPFID